MNRHSDAGESPSTASSARPTVRPRWWPAIVFVVLTVAGIAWIQWSGDAQQQDKNLRSYLLAVGCYGCLLLWLVLLSRLRLVLRVSLLGVLVLLPAGLFATLRIKGVDGDLVPIFQWRWRDSMARDSGATRGNTTAVRSDDEIRPDGWPQFLGPDRNCTVTGVVLARDWDAAPPLERWRISVGPGWSGFAVADGFAVTMEQHGPLEGVSCYNASTGERIWIHTYEARYHTTLGGEGPRATPSIDDGRVYAVGATGWLNCLDLESGEVIWKQNLLEGSDGPIPDWGLSVSPLIVENQLVQGVGGRYGLIALDKITGETLWTGGTDDLHYSSPILHSIHGSPQVVAFHTASVAGYDLETGQARWQHPYASDHAHTAAPLTIAPGTILFSSGYGHGSELFKIQADDAGRWSVEQVWTSRRMKAKFTNLVAKDGFVYGLDDGIFACIAAETGDLQWKAGRYGHGQVILVGELLLVSAETGHLVLLEPSPVELRELGKVKVFAGKTWNPPALAGRYLFMRTDQEAVCLELALVE